MFVVAIGETLHMRLEELIEKTTHVGGRNGFFQHHMCAWHESTQAVRTWKGEG
jgi:hypothetical protein